MYCDACCQSKEEESQGPMLRHSESAEEQGYPKGGNGYYLDFQGYGLMMQEVGKIRTQLRMVHQPFVELPVAAQEKERGQKQKGRSREYGKKYSQHSQPQGNQAQYGKQYSHFVL